MRNPDFISRLVTARLLAEAHGFKNTEAAIANLIKECTKEIQTEALDPNAITATQERLEIENLH